MAANMGQGGATMMDFTCPHCKETLHVPERYVGASGTCKKCGGKITIMMTSPFVPKSGLLMPTSLKDYAHRNEQILEAAAKGRTEEVTALLRSGANVNAKDKFAMMPLHHAARFGHVEVVKILVAEGADVNARAGDGCTPLHYAATAAHKETLKILAARVFNIDAKDKDGQTPLHLVARSIADKTTVKDIVTMLIARGANVNARSMDGSTPMHEAQEHGHPEVVDLLRQYGGHE